MPTSSIHTTRAVFFDLDGTLLDTAPDMVGALNLLLKEEDAPAIDYDIARKVVSDGTQALVNLGFGLRTGKLSPLTTEPALISNPIAFIKGVVKNSGLFVTTPQTMLLDSKYSNVFSIPSKNTVSTQTFSAYITRYRSQRRLKSASD